MFPVFWILHLNFNLFTYWLSAFQFILQVALLQDQHFTYWMIDPSKNRYGCFYSGDVYRCSTNLHENFKITKNEIKYQIVNNQVNKYKIK